MEQALAYFNNCLLTAMNLPAYLTSTNGVMVFDVEKFKHDVYYAVVFLNVASSYNRSKHPLEEQRIEDEYGRRIGLEITGLADVLAALDLPYGSKESLEFCERIAKVKAYAEIEASLDMVEYFGVAPAFTQMLERGDTMDGFLSTPYMQQIDLPPDLYRRIAESNGLANTAWGTIGPCGSLSIMAGNCTGGIEPLFALMYERQTRLSEDTFSCIHMPAALELLQYMDTLGIDSVQMETIREDLCYQEANQIHYSDRIKVQAAWQKYVDASISSTVNLPNDATVQDVFNIYLEGWQAGLKGITVFRDGCKKGVLSTSPTPPPEATVAADVEGVPDLSAFGLCERELLDIETAVRHRVMWQGSKVYVNVSVDDQENPVEIFAKLPRKAGYNGNGIYSEQALQEKTSHWDTICRLISVLLRVGMPAERIINQLDKSSYSMTDAAGILARVLKYHLPQIDATEEEIVERGLGEVCPSCAERTYVVSMGCGVCCSCGYTSCG